MRTDDAPGRKPGGIGGMRKPASIEVAAGPVSRSQMLEMATGDAPPLAGELMPPESDVLLQIPVDKIVRSPYQPRLIFNQDALEALANSIEAMGLAKALTVRPLMNGTYELVGGERRWRAHKLLGRINVLCVIKHMDDATAKVLALTDNEGQEQLTEYERGRSYARILTDQDEPSQRALARRLGVNVSIVSRCLLLMELPESVRKILDEAPALIGGFRVKEFIDFGKDHPDLLDRAVLKLLHEGISQDEALRWIEKTIAHNAPTKATTRFTGKEITGLGTMRVDGSKVEFRCAKTIDVTALTAKVEEFLKSLDLASLAKASD